MTTIAYAVPILPGQSEAAGRFLVDLEEAGFTEHYLELNRRGEVTRHQEWVEALPTGDLLVVVFETDAPDKLARQFEDNEYDNWWRARVKRIHGFDPADGGVIPVQTLNWQPDSL